MHKITNSLGIIPARYASSRFPGKPLVEIHGKSMVRRVYEQALGASLSAVVVATDDERIFDEVRSFGGQVVMTAAGHANGTDRCAEVAKMPQFTGFQWIVNVQGDEPFVHPAQIDRLLGILTREGGPGIATLAKKIEDPALLHQPNTVKLVMGPDHRALYFSRSAIPYIRGVAEEDWLSVHDFYKHIGLYGFGREALLAVTGLAPGLLERAESLEQLRWLEHGFQIAVGLTELETFGIDTPDDLRRYLEAH